MKKINLPVFILLFFTTFNGYSQPEKSKMDWWEDAKFGLFVHWGVYAVPGGIYKGEEVNGIGEWIMSKAKIPVAEYKAFATEFNPIKYDPEAWVKMVKDAGMKYLVITSKHHDGFALFDSKVTDWDMVDATPYGKDLLKPLAEACHKEGIKLGFYYSQAQDWCHPGGATSNGKYWDTAQEGDMDEYLDKVAVPQVKEILENYGEIDILWWDTPRNMNDERAKKFLPLVNKYPNLITNDRLAAGFPGDTESPEQYVPATGFPGRHWEVCMTMNDTWGYKYDDDNWKSVETMLHTLVDIVSKGGNYLLNVGPTPEGLIPDASVQRLQEIGGWMKTNGESIYGTTASPFHYLSWGRSTQKGDKVYLHVFDWPQNGQLSVTLLNKVKKAYLLAEPGKKLKVKTSGTRATVQLPASAPDKHVSVVVLELDGPPNVLPIPSAGKKVKVSSERTGHEGIKLTDGDPKNSWKPEAGEQVPWAEIDLGEETPIQAVSVVEPWRLWDKKGQTYQLQYFSGEAWKTVSEFATNGTGHVEDIKPLKASRFRLKITESKDPLLSEWILYRAE